MIFFNFKQHFIGLVVIFTLLGESRLTPHRNPRLKRVTGDVELLDFRVGP